MNKKIAAFIFVKSSYITLYPPLLNDIDTDYFALTELSDITSDYWVIKQIKNLDKVEKTIRDNPQSYFGFYDKYIEIKEEQIIVGKLSENDDCIVTVPTIQSLVPSHIPLVEPSTLTPALNPSYTKGKYDGYPLQLSICLPISNRSDSLEKCLLGLKPLLEQLPSELIVVDTSSDGSRQIAEQYGAKIIPFKWTGDFSAARNTAIQQASGAWIFSIDDDEWLDDVSEIINFFHSSEWKRYNVGLYNVRNYTTIEGLEFEEMSVQRMAKNHPRLHYIHAIHECFDLSLMPSPLHLKYFSVFAHHYGYAYKDDTERDLKAIRNIAGSYTALKESPSDLRLLYQLANELTIIRDFKSSVAYCFKVMALAKKYPHLNLTGMNWDQNALMFLFVVGNLSKNRELFKQITPLINLEQLNCFKAATINYILAIHSFDTNDYISVCNYAVQYNKFRNEFLKIKNQADLASGITVNLVAPQIRANAIYIIHTFALLEQNLEEEALGVFIKVDLKLTNELDLAILAKILYSFSINSFEKLSTTISDNLLEALFKYCKYQVRECKAESPKVFRDLIEKMSHSEVNQCNIYYRLAHMYANPSDFSIYESFCTDKSNLVAHMDDILIVAIKNGFNIFRFLPLLSMEDLQQGLKVLSLQNLEHFTIIIQQLIGLAQPIELSSFTLKEIFFISGSIEIALFNEDLCIWQKTSKEYKNHFLLYISLLNIWSLQTYNQSLFVKDNFDLLPSTYRGAYRIKKGIEAKETDNLEGYMQYLKSAVVECPIFNNGIKLLLKDLSNQNTNSLDVAEKTEFELLGEQLKTTAKQMIASENYTEAKNILLQLSKLLPSDNEIINLLSLCKDPVLLH